ncbi:YwpF family protein [Alkalihalobacillus sp. FSL R5-0424]
MKTFKLHALYLLAGDNESIRQESVPLKDGLIISMENKERTWFIDAVVSEEDMHFFEGEQKANRHVFLNVIITSKDNHPAAMITSIETIKKLSDGYSIIFKGRIVLGRDDVLEDVLEELLTDGHSTESLLERFKQRTENLESYSEKTLNEVYKDLKESGNYVLL